MDIQKKLRKIYSETYLQEILDERVTKILILETYRGSIFIELFHHDFPLLKEIIARALLGEYDGTIFYNCNPYFIQLRKSVEEKELTNKIIRPYLKNSKGTFGLINSKRDPNKALLDHFYICMSEIPEIDGEYTILGRVIKGLDVLNKIWDGNTIRRAYIEKGYVAKPSTIKKLNILYWFGLAAIIFYCFWLLSNHLQFLKDFQQEIFNSVFTDKISNAKSLYIFGAGLVLIIFSLIVSGIQGRLKMGTPKNNIKARKMETGIMENIKSRQVKLTRELEKYQEKEISGKEGEKYDKKELEEKKRLEQEIMSLKKKAEDEKKEIEALRLSMENEKKKREDFQDKLKGEKIDGKEREEEEKRLKKLELKERKRLEQEEKNKKKEEEQMRKKQEKELETQEKIKQQEPVQEMKPIENPEERKKLIQKMKKNSDIKEEVTKKKKDEIKKEVLPKLAQKTETQLDVLYDLLEKNNSLKLTYIMQTFSISKEEAIEWCNILMGSGLAELKYPAFGDPILIKK